MSGISQCFKGWFGEIRRDRIGGMNTHIDYNVLAKKYDLTRTADFDILNRFVEEIPLDGKTILDFGCGTGNFAFALSKLTTAKVYGIEPSDGMIEKAAAKNIDVKKGDHSDIPFDDDFFDFIYMTDVIHHIPDLNTMFTELMRVMKSDGLVCVS
jgi:ubiquinone/menaquinone biosynthesis C-methylase UbiE